MNVTLGPIVYPVGRLAQARQDFAHLLGSAPSVDSAFYVGFDLVPGLHLGLQATDGGGHAGPCVYWSTDDLDATISAPRRRRVRRDRRAEDVGGGERVAELRDRDGSRIGLQALRA